ncbi:MAG: hypothetical protein BWX71_02170 [Deltaproteobacteria bacterium ADurb.Bin072]|nr:MAG: hypothetical protein BWX71_02170 [Deltaproteobacteria bacterium ADurb.Bin072]
MVDALIHNNNGRRFLLQGVAGIPGGLKNLGDGSVYREVRILARIYPIMPTRGMRNFRKTRPRM